MAKFKLKTKEAFKFGQTNHIPVVDKVTFGPAGELEVDITEDELSQLLEFMPDLYLADKENKKADPITPQTKTPEIGKSADDKNDIGGTKDGEDESLEETEAAMRKYIDDANADDLKKFASDNKLPGKEWGSLAVADLKVYLKEKLNLKAAA